MRGGSNRERRSERLIFSAPGCGSAAELGSSPSASRGIQSSSPACRPLSIATGFARVKRISGTPYDFAIWYRLSPRWTTCRASHESFASMPPASGMDSTCPTERASVVSAFFCLIKSTLLPYRLASECSVSPLRTVCHTSAVAFTTVCSLDSTAGILSTPFIVSSSDVRPL